MILSIGFSAQIKAAFPGSEWATANSSSREQLGPDSQNPGFLRPSPASTVPVSGGPCSADPLPQGSARADNFATQPQSLAVIGGTKFDEPALKAWLSSLPLDTVIVTGDGRGAEKALRSLCEASGVRVDVPALLDIPKALEAQIGTVLSMTQDSRTPIVLIGSGGRVNTAKAWFKRGEWGREVVEL